MQAPARSGFLSLLGYLVLLTFNCAYSIAIGQNLVPNPSFESFLQLPCDQNEYFIQQLVTNWTQPLSTSTDYFNTESELSCFLNPRSHGIEPNSGNGAIGIVTFETVFGSPTHYQEYIEVKLSRKLKLGQIYRLRFFARWSPISATANLKSNNIGIAFSEKSIQYDISSSPLELRLPTALNESKVIGEEWTEIMTCWRADKEYEYLLVGNFYPDSTIVQGVSEGQHQQNSYYLIDDISVEELGREVDLHEVAFCPDKESVSLNATLPGAIGYKWQDGSSNPVLNISDKKSSSYWVDIQFATCWYRDNFLVNYLTPVDLGPDTTLCADASYILKVAHSNYSLIWNDGSQDTIRVITTSGNYFVKALTDDCVIADTVAVNFVECPGFVPNVITPNGDLKNDFFVVEYADKAEWSVKIFNRWGVVVFYSEKYDNKWDGDGLPDGIYYYVLQSRHLSRTVTGWVNVLR